MPKHIMPLVPPGLLVRQILPDPDCILIVTTPRQDAAACPSCAACSSQVHSRYNRLPGDLPWQRRPVMLQVQARRFTDELLAHVRTPGGPSGSMQPLLRFNRSSPTLCSGSSLIRSNHRGTDPYARWCGRGGAVRHPPIPTNPKYGVSQAFGRSV